MKDTDATAKAEPGESPLKEYADRNTAAVGKAVRQSMEGEPIKGYESGGYNGLMGKYSREFVVECARRGDVAVTVEIDRDVIVLRRLGPPAEFLGVGILDVPFAALDNMAHTKGIQYGMMDEYLKWLPTMATAFFCYELPWDEDHGLREDRTIARWRRFLMARGYINPFDLNHGVFSKAVAKRFIGGDTVYHEFKEQERDAQELHVLRAFHREVQAKKGLDGDAACLMFKHWTTEELEHYAMTGEAPDKPGLGIEAGQQGTCGNCGGPNTETYVGLIKCRQLLPGEAMKGGATCPAWTPSPGTGHTCGECVGGDTPTVPGDGPPCVNNHVAEDEPACEYFKPRTDKGKVFEPKLLLVYQALHRMACDEGHGNKGSPGKMMKHWTVEELAHCIDTGAMPKDNDH